MATVLRSVFYEVRATLVILALIVPLLAFGTWDVQHRVAESASLQSRIRIAQTLRGRLLRLQIDEETGLRGFLYTRDRRFLGPYVAGTAAFAPQAASLRALLDQLDDADARAIVDVEVGINDIWLRDVSRPLLAHPRTLDLPLQLDGKDLVDNFRARDQEIIGLLDRDARTADAALARALRVQITFDVLLLIVLGAGGTILAYFLSRSARRAFENRVLYQNQKRIADSLQTAFLQKSLPLAPGIGLHAMYVPATAEAQVGGDWYDAFTLPDGRLLFSIGDVAGHGLDAAVVMSRARQAIVAAALQENDPALVLARANEAIMLRDTRMVTAICGFIDPQSLELSYATAGHPPPVLARPGAEAEFLPHEGIPLGIVSTVYRTFVARASHDALVAFYTDGVIEHKRDIFDGERRLLDAVGAAVGRDDPAVAIHEAIFGGAAASDDVAIFTVTFSAEGGAKPSATVEAMQTKRLSVESTEVVAEGSNVAARAIRYADLRLRTSVAGPIADGPRRV